MIRSALPAVLAIALSPTGAIAQDAPWQMPRADDAPPPGESRRYELPRSESGPLDDFFNDLLSRAQPHLEGLARDMTGLIQDYRPVLDDLATLIDDMGNYDLPPERLPNGDIIIRRKADAPPPPPVDLNRLAPRRDRVTPETPPAPAPQIDL